LEVGQRRGDSWDKLVQRWNLDHGQMNGIFQAARHVASEASLPGEDRKAAIRLLGQGGDESKSKESKGDVQTLGELLGVRQAPDIELAAIAALAKRQEKSVVDALLGSWSSLGPEYRTAVLNVLLSRDAWTTELLNRIDRGQISAHQIGTSTRQRLLQHTQSNVRERAQQLFGVVSQQRTQLLERYTSVASLTPAPEQGAKLFAQHCATCHRLKEQGVALGPDLAALTDKSVTSLLVAILDPNRTVEPVYVNYTARLGDGRELEGLVVGETANNITLRSAGGVETVVLRSDLRELRSLGLSLMPEGLEQALNPQQMADLISYVQSK
jgi:putative heme-binding domain-containing protein